MPMIRKTIAVKASPQKVWENVADIGGISKLIGFLSGSVVDGDTRICDLAQGGQLTEKIVTVDHDAMRVAYAIVDSPLNLEFHASTMEVSASDDGAIVTWTTDLTPAEAVAQIEPMLDAAVADMMTTLAA